MYLQKTASTYGRLVAKPVKEDDNEILFEENITLQDQIENLRTKISLKERYNKVQTEELEECRVGATTITSDLWSETHKLRNQLSEALDAEKKAVHNALRSHRDFQRALSGKIPAFAVAWLDDKVFDMSKRLNRLLDCLVSKRMKLKESEGLVKLFEQVPRAVGDKWEADTNKVCKQLEYAIENMKVKRETVNILHSKYHQIKLVLLDERGHYAPTLRALENQLQTQKRELDQLKKMLGDAIVFQNDAVRNLGATEKEASENRRRRRRQILRMKKAVQKVLEANMMKKREESLKTEQNLKITSSFGAEHENSLANGDIPQVDSSLVLRYRKAEVEKYQDKARRLVDCMRVPDLTFIPQRLREVFGLSQRLSVDEQTKEKARDFLIRQRDQLFLIYNYMAHTGQKTEAAYKAAEASVKDATDTVENDIRETRKKIQTFGEITIDVRVGIISILEILDEAPAKRQSSKTDMRTLLKMLNAKVSKLVSFVQELESELHMKADLEDPETMKTYIRNTPIPPRLIRVGTAENRDDSEDDEYDDLKVATRTDIKAKSARVLSVALLKKGLL